MQFCLVLFICNSFVTVSSKLHIIWTSIHLFTGQFFCIVLLLLLSKQKSNCLHFWHRMVMLMIIITIIIKCFERKSRWNVVKHAAKNINSIFKLKFNKNSEKIINSLNLSKAYSLCYALKLVGDLSTVSSWPSWNVAVVNC